MHFIIFTALLALVSASGHRPMIFGSRSITGPSHIAAVGHSSSGPSGHIAAVGRSFSGPSGHIAAVGRSVSGPVHGGQGGFIGFGAGHGGKFGGF